MTSWFNRSKGKFNWTDFLNTLLSSFHYFITFFSFHFNSHLHVIANYCMEISNIMNMELAWIINIVPWPLTTNFRLWILGWITYSMWFLCTNVAYLYCIKRQLHTAGLFLPVGWIYKLWSRQTVSTWWYLISSSASFPHSLFLRHNPLSTILLIYSY